MVDEFMICVDRLIASACFESVNEREKLLAGGGDEAVVTQNNLPSVTSNNGGEGCSKKIVRECRICQEEDEEHQMEAPCACNGTLKFAHRKCIQRWCNKKGDITCEICSQVYSPNYIVPPPRVSPEVIAIDIRQAWGSHIDLRNPRFLTLTVAQRELLESEYDEYTVANSSSLACFRYVAIMLMFILLIRQVLMLSRDFGMVQDSSTIFNVSLLQLAGFLLPCYVMARSCCIMQNRRRRQIEIGTSSSPILPDPGSPCYKSDGKSDPGSPWYESDELRRYQCKAVGSSTILCHPMYGAPGQALMHIAAFPIPRTDGGFRVRERKRTESF